MVYAIVDNNVFNDIENNLLRISKLASMISYRDKNSFYFSKNAKLFIEKARKYNFNKILLHSNYKLAYKLKADGVHLNSKSFNDITFSKKLNLFTISSTHSLEEAKYVENLKGDIITFSPIFSSPNKGDGIGLKKLLELTKKINIPVIALGGITTQEKINLVKKNGAIGFSSIRYFYKC